MGSKLQLELNQCKLIRWTRTDVRLFGWVQYMTNRSTKPWIHLCIKKFCKTTGIGERTARRSLKKLRTSPESELVARTINQNGTWQILVSTTTRLSGLKRSEPFLEMNDSVTGRRVAPPSEERIVKVHLRGERITEEQLVLNSDPIMWKGTPNSKFGETSDDPSTDQEVGGSTHPNQMELPITPSNCATRKKPVYSCSSGTTNKFIWSSSRDCHFGPDTNIKGFTKVKQRNKHTPQRDEFGVKTRKLAMWIARNEIQDEFWDNCKVRHSMPHCFNYVFDELRLGCNRKTIVRAFRMALEDVHGLAVDKGVTESGSWAPSSVVARARRILADGECRGKYWSRSKNRKQVLVSANT